VGQKSKIRIVLSFVVFITLVVVLSSVSARLWGEKPEKASLRPELVFQEKMTISEFGKTNQLPNTVLKEVFGLASKEDLQKKITEFQYSQDQVVNRVNKRLALEGEHASKNWSKILVKFVLWFLFLGLVFFLMRKGRITSGNRRWALFSGVIVFGIVLGSDPSPMGTIKDAIVLFAKNGVVFPPRMIALTLFLILVFVANKFICTWGCQVGTLQDFIFRLNRDPKDRRGIFRQFKPSFFLSNTFRVVFLGAFTLIAFLWKADLIELIDPFKTFNPGRIALAGGIFIGAVSLASLFIYRPWCHFFCPFGLVGWIVEKKSLFKVKVDYDTCIACEACVRACPSTVMNVILKQNRVTPDCFSCATCIEACPTGSIGFTSGKRSKPSAKKFEKKEA
jgi:polyferredoxin